MKYKKILLTGGFGNLGSFILNSENFNNIFAPTHNELDICDKGSIKNFFQNNEIDAVIHCAALARMKECKNNPIKTLETNLVGTSNLVKEILIMEEKRKKIRFIHISTDGIYGGTRGNYSEKDATIPHNIYGWSKLGAESAVNLLTDYCIIRTSFFDPIKINFQESPDDIYTSKIPVKELVDAINFLLESNFIGTINVGGPRKSFYELYKEFIPSLKPCKLKDIKDNLTIELPEDSSMDVSLWNKIGNNKIHEIN